jgi:phosphoribosylamine-glycine ligase
MGGDQVTPEQSARLTDLEGQMRSIARRAVSQNEYNRRMNQCDDLRQFLVVASHGYAHEHTADEWMEIAEKAVEGEQA